jgi:hypothetical protein
MRLRKLKNALSRSRSVPQLSKNAADACCSGLRAAENLKSMDTSVIAGLDPAISMGRAAPY